MPAIRFPSFAAAGLVLLLQACASAPPVEEVAVAPEPQQPVPELTLNLPEEQSCVCVRNEEADYTFLEKGFNTLVVGDHIEAVEYFQRYQRLESSPEADWEAGIAIAYDSMLSQSPFYDPQAAVKSYENLAKKQTEGVQLHPNALMMRNALEQFVAMQLQITSLQSDNATLAQDLEKREEAIRRLRALTLGQ